MVVKLLTEHHLEYLSLKEGCRCSSESTLVKMLEISCHGSILYKIVILNKSCFKQRAMYVCDTTYFLIIDQYIAFCLGDVSV